MERLMVHAVAALAETHDVTVIGPSGGDRHCPDAVRYHGCPASPALFLPCALTKGLREARRGSYGLVLGGSGVVAPITRTIARVAGARSSLFVHGLDLVAASAIYQRIFVPAIRQHDLIIANSENTRRLAIDRGCDETAVSVVNPGCQLPKPGDSPDVGTLRSAHALDDARIVLFVGRMIRRKGLQPFIREAWPGITAGVDRAKLVIVGDSPADALNRDEADARELESAVAAATPESIRFLGKVNDDVLAACYASADCLVFPLIPVDGDVEGFGMVATEAAAWGTPTIAFRVGGVADAVSDDLSGRLISPGDYEAFAAAVIEACTERRYVKEDIRQFASEFAWPRYAKKLRRALGLTPARERDE